VTSIRLALAGLIGVALAVVALSIGPSLASADQTCYTGCTTTIPPTVVATEDARPPVELASAPASADSLAFTGADVAGTVAIALVALAAGGALVVVSRRRRATS
jgi:hypothetical protein